MSEKTKFLYALSCEDIREEVRNKKSLIGVYNGDIVATEMPAKIRLAFFIVIEKPLEGPEKLLISILIDENEIGSGEQEITETGIVSVTIPPALISFEKQSNLRLVGSMDDGEKFTIIDQKIRLAE